MQVTTSTSSSSCTHTCTRMSTYRCCEFGRLCRLSTLLTDRRQRSAQGWDVVGGEAPVQGRAAVAILSSAVQGKEGRLFAWRSQAAASPHALVGHADWKTRNTLAFMSARTSSKLVWGFGGRCGVGDGSRGGCPLPSNQPPFGVRRWRHIQDNWYTGQMPSLASTSPLFVVV